MKTQNSVSQKFRILHKINKNKDILNRNVRLLKECVQFCALNTWLGLLLLLLQTLGPWFSNVIQNVLSSEKRTLDHWATVQQFFSLAQVRGFWHSFCFRSGLVAIFLKMSLDALLKLQFTPCEALSSVWIGFSWQYSQACGHPCCLWTFSYPISSFRST